jgi:hypothetical protein
VIAWPCGESGEGALFDHSSVEVHEEGRRWSVACSSHRLNGASVVAVAFKGRWLGRAIRGDPVNLLWHLSELNENKHLVASLVRWFRLPVLLRNRPTDAPAFTAFAHSYPEAVMAAWLGTEGLPHSLAHDDAFDRRQLEATELRELYLGWSPTSEQAQNIVATLGQNIDDPLGDVAIMLLPELPLIAGHIIRHWLNMRGTPPNCSVSFYLKVLRHRIASKYLNGRTTLGQMEELLLKAAESMKAEPEATADERFVEQAIVAPAIQTLRGRSLTAVERSNLAVALQVASFRQYLAMCVLTEVEREILH